MLIARYQKVKKASFDISTERQHSTPLEMSAITIHLNPDLRKQSSGSVQLPTLNI